MIASGARHDNASLRTWRELFFVADAIIEGSGGTADDRMSLEALWADHLPEWLKRVGETGGLMRLADF